MKSLLNILIAAFLFLNYSYVFADECSDNSKLNCLCKVEKITPPKTNYHTDLRRLAIDVRNTLCTTKNEKQVINSLINFIQESDKWLHQTVKLKSIDSIHSKIIFSETILGTRGKTNNAIPNITQLPIDLDEPWLVEQHQFRVANVGECDQEIQRRTTQSDCAQALDEFVQLYQYAHHSYAIINSKEVLIENIRLDKEWDDYLAKSRSQTPLELLINSSIYKQKKENLFNSPPNWQLILLHPTVVIENVNNALDGEKVEESLAVELIGYDRWNNKKWYVPSGVSLIATYSDRRDVEDLGLGVSLHFNSKFSIGYTKRDEGDGFFISYDFFNLLNDKKKLISSYRN